MHAFDNTCHRIQNCNGCQDKACLYKCQDNISLALKTNVSIFKTALDVRIESLFLKMYVKILKTAMDVRITNVYINVRITYA